MLLFFAALLLLSYIYFFDCIVIQLIQWLWCASKSHELSFSLIFIYLPLLVFSSFPSLLLRLFVLFFVFFFSYFSTSYLYFFPFSFLLSFFYILILLLLSFFIFFFSFLFFLHYSSTFLPPSVTQTCSAFWTSVRHI